MKSVNFEFIRKPHPELAEYGALAEHHLETDPGSSLVKLRNAAEYLISEIYDRWNIKRPRAMSGGDPDLYDLLNCNEFTKRVPLSVGKALDLARRNGKQGAHHGYAVDRPAALESLEAIHRAAAWFAFTFDRITDRPPFDRNRLVKEAVTRRELRRDREESLRRESRLVGEVRRLQQELVSEKEHASQLLKQQELGRSAATLLFPPDLGAPSAAEVAEAGEELAAYCERLQKRLGDLAPLVSPSVESGASTFQVVCDAVATGRHVSIVATSGMGKSHLATHVMSTFTNESTALFIFARARYFEGDVDDWLDRSIAAQSTHTAATMLHMARLARLRAVLVVDGLNECPPSHEPALMEALEALALRDEMGIVITSQRKPPAHFPLEEVALGTYSVEERRSILRAHGAPAALGVLASAFATPFELELAARCASSVGQSASTFEVLSLYARTQTEFDRDTAFQLLLDFASELTSKLRFALPLSRVCRLPRADVSAETLVQRLATGTLLHTEEGRVSFRHELLQDFFLAEWLLRDCRTTEELANRLEAPRYASARPFVIQALAADGDLRRFLMQADWIVELLPTIATGDFGARARGVVVDEIRRVVASAVDDLDNVSVTSVIEETPTSPNSQREGRSRYRRVEFKNGRQWSRYEISLLHALGGLVRGGESLTIARPLIEGTDALVERARGLDVPTKVAYGELYGLLSQRAMPASVIVGAACNQAWPRRVADCALPLASECTNLSAGMAKIACALLRSALVAKLSETPSDLARHVPALVEHAWAFGFYHLRLEALDLIMMSISSADEDTRARLKALVESLDTEKNIGLNSLWVEVASALGLVESPVSADDIAKQLEELLRTPEDSMAREIAYHLYTNQLEDVMSSEHIEAIDGLDVKQRLRFRCMAALGMPSYSFSVEMVLREILDDPRLLEETMSREVFEKFSAVPAPDESFPQGVVAGFALAMLGRAAFGMPPPALVSAELRDLAWSAWGAILYWTAVPNMSTDERRAKTATAWRALRAHLDQAPGPLFELHRHERFVSWEDRAIWFGLVHNWPAEVCDLLECAVSRLDDLQPAFRHPERQALLAFVIETFATLAGSRARPLIEPHADRPDVGKATIVALLAIEAEG